ncbi:MAG TPA: PRTRC system ThiF family protein [Bryobacteraceae bacterium]|nr:PRTRC system ThiF family protein [Bryobacterales bacterium]HRJ17403.1 PRTRC system ThiF family protein [Bryobacteraceae bacterium]
METHFLHEDLLHREVRVLVVGCGGTGSVVIGGLPYIHQAMLVQGHPYGLRVTVMDGDTVSPFNCVRQPFSRSEIGLNKAIVLVSRINLFWGLNWIAIPLPLTAETLAASYAGNGGPALRPDIVIGCVDTRAARAIIAEGTASSSGVGYWLDIGNSASSGQFVLGEPRNARNRRSRTRLPTVAEVLPEIVDPALDDDDEPSCSAIEALERQECFVNTVLAHHALALLAQLFRHGRISRHGGFVDIAHSRAVPLSIDPRLWRRMGKRAGLSRPAIDGPSSVAGP